jgi:uncharacterized OB-fold protein
MGGFIDKPVPNPSEDSNPFWEGCQRKELLIQQCKGCGYHRFPPALLCPRCLSMESSWICASGKAVVYSFEITHRPFFPAWDPPYNVAIVELAEGPRMHTNIVGCSNDEICIGMPVEVLFEKIEDQDWLLPKFKPCTKG